jgi:hypothetical protein
MCKRVRVLSLLKRNKELNVNYDVIVPFITFVFSFLPITFLGGGG